MIYLYAVTGPLQAPLEATGLEGAPLERIAVGGLTAIYSVHANLEPRPDPESCWAHERAVEAVMRSETVLPARFGSTFVDIDDLQAAIAREAPALSDRLIELDGCVELAVRIGPLTPEVEHYRDGRDYLVEKLSVQRRREAVAVGTLACLRELAVASKPAAQSIRDSQVSLSYLVRVDEVERFVRAVERLGRRSTKFALSCTGPWAPYSFATTSDPRPSDSRSADFAGASARPVIAEVL